MRLRLLRRAVRGAADALPLQLLSHAGRQVRLQRGVRGRHDGRRLRRHVGLRQRRRRAAGHAQAAHGQLQRGPLRGAGVGVGRRGGLHQAGLRRRKGRKAAFGRRGDWSVWRERRAQRKEAGGRVEADWSTLAGWLEEGRSAGLCVRVCVCVCTGGSWEKGGEERERRAWHCRQADGVCKTAGAACEASGALCHGRRAVTKQTRRPRRAEVCWQGRVYFWVSWGGRQCGCRRPPSSLRSAVPQGGEWGGGGGEGGEGREGRDKGHKGAQRERRHARTSLETDDVALPQAVLFSIFLSSICISLVLAVCVCGCGCGGRSVAVGRCGGGGDEGGRGNGGDKGRRIALVLTYRSRAHVSNSGKQRARFLSPSLSLSLSASFYARGRLCAARATRATFFEEDSHTGRRVQTQPASRSGTE